jgi:hypothetical protein
VKCVCSLQEDQQCGGGGNGASMALLPCLYMCVKQHNHVCACRKTSMQWSEVLPYHSDMCVPLQEDQQWGEVAGDLPTGLRGRLVLSLLRSSCRGLMEQLGAGEARHAQQVGRYVTCHITQTLLQQMGGFW